MKTITVEIKYTIQRASKETCDRLNEPLGSFEILNPDGTCEVFVETEQKGIDYIREIYNELYFGDFEIDVDGIVQ
jgi:hypothetical protein